MAANIIKYTGETVNVSATNLATGHHFSYMMVKGDFGSEVSVTGLSTSYTKFTSTSTGAKTIQDLSVSYNTKDVTITSYAVWDNNQASNTFTGVLTVRQATQFTESVKKSIWVGETATLSYTISHAFDPAVEIVVADGPLTAASKPAGTAATSITSVAKKSGSANVEFNPNTKKGNHSGHSVIVNAYQPYTDIICDKSGTISVVSGGNLTVNLAVSASNTNDTNATANIYQPVVWHTFTGSATNSVSTSAALTVAKSNTATTAFTLNNITSGGTLSFTAKAGDPGTNIGVATGTNLSKSITITLKSLTITFYNDSSCTTATTNINPGDYFFAKVSGGAGDSGTLSVATGGSVATASILDNGGSSKITVNSNASTGSLKVTYTPSNGSAITENITIQNVALTLA